ncbi:phage tail spike protein [Mesobacillus sp. S13]|uniref:phage tail spike protein n=1 Tax=Mesobacillus sp. S13 TaxID=2880221 RepID=UPI001CF508D3|nr:phage tail spike protein [Mesobacillus sp. S13]
MPEKETLIHILHRQSDEILGTLSTKKAEFNNAIRTDSLENINTFDFIANAKVEKAALLEKRNRILLQDEDGGFREYIINRTEQFSRTEKLVRTDASFIDLGKAKVIYPQTLTGATSSTAVQLALSGTKWKPGVIDFTYIRTINIETHTNPLALLKLIASEFGLEIRYRVEVKGNRIVGRYVDMREQIAGFEGKEIVFGKDLIGVKRIEDNNGIVTALLGLGPEKDDGTRISVLVEDEEALQRWGDDNGNHLIEIYEPESSDTDMTVDRLRTLTENELEKRIDAIVTYECEAASLEHIFGREHEKIRLGRTVRIKDDGYNPPLYLEARIRETEVDPAAKKVLSFKIGNFIEYKKSDLEKQISTLKNLMAQKVSRAYAAEIFEKKKVLSDTPPTDTEAIWVYPDPALEVNIAHVFDNDVEDWVPITTTDAGDIIKGVMLFDRLQGGTMTLGGTNNGYGRMMVLDANGEVIADLNAETGGFSDLYVAKLQSPSVVGYNDQDISLVVDPINGNDLNSGIGISNAKKTIQACIDSIPKHNDGNILITLHYDNAREIYENVRIEGFTGKGKITLDGQIVLNYITGDIIVTGCTNEIDVKLLTLKTTNGVGLEVFRSPYVYANNVRVQGQGNGRGFYAGEGGNLWLTECNVVGAALGIYARYFGNVYVRNCTGLGETYGMAAQSGGVIRGLGTAPGGKTSNTYVEADSTIQGSFTYPSAPAPEAPATETTKTWAASSGDNWSTSGYWGGDGVKQGNWGYGRRTGLWLFGSAPSTAVTGKTIKNIRVKITRSSSGGYSGKVPIFVGYHGYTSKPGSSPTVSGAYHAVSLGYGESAWVTLPASFRTAFANGTAKGIGVYVASDSRSYYAALSAAATLEITYA